MLASSRPVLLMVTPKGKTAEETVALTVRVPRELRQRLRVFAAQEGVSVQQCTVEAVQAWLEQQQRGAGMAR